MNSLAIQLRHNIIGIFMLIVGLLGVWYSCRYGSQYDALKDVCKGVVDGAFVALNVRNIAANVLPDPLPPNSTAKTITTVETGN